jgi:hypothetical protein
VGVFVWEDCVKCFFANYSDDPADRAGRLKPVLRTCTLNVRRLDWVELWSVSFGEVSANNRCWSKWLRVEFCLLELFMSSVAAAPRSHTEYSERAFPELDAAELELLRPLGIEEAYPDGTVLFKAGSRDIDFLIVLSGGIDVRNPANDDSLIITHGPGHFVGDIDMLTRRPVIVSATTNGPTTILRIPGRSCGIF